MANPKAGWHDDARHLDKQGMTRTAIAKTVGRSITRVSRVLTAAPRPEQSVCREEGAGSTWFEPHVPRTPRQLIDYEALKKAAPLFAAGKISREQFLRRIEAKP